MNETPTMETRELKDHSGWYVRMTWASGHVEDVDMSTESEARDWINRKSAAWLAGRAEAKRPAS